MLTTLFADMDALNAAVRAARDKALKDSHAACGRRGFHRSRGAWIICTTARDTAPNWSEGHCEFQGTRKQLDDVLGEARANPDIVGVHVDGGFNYAPSLREMNDCDYEPYTGEFSVHVWDRDSEAAQ